MIRVPSPAKLNLFLHIVGRRDNGYHELQSIFQLIDLYDWISFEAIEENQVQIEGVAEVKLEQNLIYRAAQYLRPHAKTPCGLKISVEKNIPMGAGLGGGSSNAATTLIVLNQLWQCGLNDEQLAAYGVQLGADVPIFIFGQDAIAEGIGEILTPITLPSQQFLLLKPDAHINTAALFQHPNLQRNCTHFDHTRLSQQRQDFCDILSPAFSNVFEPVVEALAPSVATALTYLKSLSTLTGTTPRLTGSGSCVFLPLPLTGSRHVPADMLSTWQHQAPAPSYIVKTLARGSPDRQIF